MKKTQKFLVPIYGLRNSLRHKIKLDTGLSLRNINLLEKEHEFFRKYGLEGDYKVILEIDYKYNSKDPNEPLPGISFNIVNRFDSSLVVFGDGKVGVAAIIPSPKKEEFPGGAILHSSKTHYGESLKKDIDDKFKTYYEKFTKAYEMRPVAFDTFRRSQDRFANNDKTIDSCIVLESLFVPKGERAKAPFILVGLKIMNFDSEEVILIRDLIDYRNSIIHADRKKQLRLIQERKFTSGKFEKTFKLVRTILYRFVQSPWS